MHLKLPRQQFIATYKGSYVNKNYSSKAEAQYYCSFKVRNITTLITNPHLKVMSDNIT